MIVRDGNCETDTPVLVCEGAWKIFQRGRRVVRALVDLSLEVRSREFLCLTGPSGSGKSTLLNLLGALDVPTKGEVYGLGLRYRGLSNEECGRFRRVNVGFVFQELRLIRHLTAVENVMLPKLFDGMDRGTLLETALRLLGQVEMTERADHFPYELSYGEQQRVAFARAIVTAPKIILADEPTANLDDASADRVLAIMHALRSSGTTVVVATHDERLTRTASRILRIEGGTLHSS